jgi:hypothetical protein
VAAEVAAWKRKARGVALCLCPVPTHPLRGPACTAYPDVVMSLVHDDLASQDKRACPVRWLDPGGLPKKQLCWGADH